MLQHLNVVTIIVVTKLLQRYNQIFTTFRPAPKNLFHGPQIRSSEDQNNQVTAPVAQESEATVSFSSKLEELIAGLRCAIRINGQKYFMCSYG